MIEWLIGLYRAYVQQVVLVVSPTAEADARALSISIPTDIAVQAQPTGMLDAVLAARDCVEGSRASQVWITWCDQVGIHPRTVARLAELSDRNPNASIVMPVAFRKNPYIHLARAGSGRIVRVLHRREGDTLPETGESDAGLFSFSRRAFLEDLQEYAKQLEVGHATKERNLLPFVPWSARTGDVITFPVVDETEAVGINTNAELAEVERYLAARKPDTLSIVIPAYNEERFIGTLLERINAVDLASLGIKKEIIVVDDCSKDRTAEIVRAQSGVILRKMDRNGGKGRAVRAGIETATGNYLIVQDADLEYDPNDYVPMLRVLLDGKADVVYGSRYMRSGKHANQSWAAYLGGRSLSLIALAFTGRYLTDTVTALKLFKRTELAALPLETTGFELDHEITARMLARGARIAEVPISYFPRTKEEGKKIGMRDWFRGFRTFWRYRRG